MEKNDLYHPGLEGVIAGKSSICKVDSENSRLLYRGYSIVDLAKYSTFEETAYLLIKGALPRKKELDDFEASLKEERRIPEQLLKMFSRFPKNSSHMDMLRAGVSFFSLFDADVNDNSHDANVKKAMRLVAKFPTLMASCCRIVHGKEPVEPKSEYSHAGNFLYMINGAPPDDYTAKLFDTSLIIYAEHEYNASTFSALVTASTLADIYSAVIAGICTLKGPLHGGANEKAMEMLLAIGEESNVETWVKSALLKKEKITGFGHRVYKKGDPRAIILKGLCREFGEKAGQTKWSGMSDKIEEIMAKEKGLYPNVDFYAGSLFYMMGMPIELYTPIFTIARIAGWSAHIIEQHDDNRLIRPASEYTGPEMQKYIPISER
ncbi:MAG: citrate synthase [Candidatus Omnitrophica bacterium]|nr:citrate synthase [Candidatus Omnitrophota bacterium]